MRRETKPERSDKRGPILIGLLLAAAVVAVYWQVYDFEFTDFDDDRYIQRNPAVLAGLTPRTVRWAFTTNHEANWHPLTWISLMADSGLARLVQSLGDTEPGTEEPGVFHLTNVALHAANVLLLFILLQRMTGSRWRSALVAALFAVHPLHVESVAWVTERKDVLSTLFWILTMLAYVAYVKNPNARRYALVLASFALGLMAKPMLVSLPLVLLLLDFWPLGRMGLSSDRTPRRQTFRKLAYEKIPLFALAAGSCAVTFWAQKTGGAVAGIARYPFGVRVANALVSCASYLRKTVWPSDLAAFYPHPGFTLPVWQVSASAFLMVFVTVIAFRAARRLPCVTVGWLWYVITLLPVIGLVQVGKQGMADRYTYVPLIGIFIAIAWGVPDLLRGKADTADKAAARRCGMPVAVCAVLAVMLLMGASYRQVGYWRDSVTLFGAAIRVTQRNALAYNNLGNGLVMKSDPEKAIWYLRKALEYEPQYLDARLNLGNALFLSGDARGAIVQFRIALKLDPRNAGAHSNLGLILARQGRFDEAIAEFEEALQISPNNPGIRSNLENALSQAGRQ